jgi:hypothetical protein
MPLLALKRPILAENDLTLALNDYPRHVSGRAVAMRPADDCCHWHHILMFGITFVRLSPTRVGFDPKGS